MLGGYEFRWDAGHIIFLGAFYVVLLVVGTFLLVSMARALRDLRQRRAETLLWHEEFQELPASRRHCRHALSGETPGRTCDRAFDCRACVRHGELLAAMAPPTRPAPAAQGEDDVYGFHMPQDRYYHRGHTWVKPLESGLLEVGLDDFGRRLVGVPDALHLPAPGARLTANGTAWQLVKGRVASRVLSPLDGTVVETGGAGRGWYLRLRPAQSPPGFTHLLRGDEIRPWVLDELERLQRLLGARSGSTALADGGAPAEDFTSAVPDADWDAVYGEMFLEA